MRNDFVTSAASGAADTPAATSINTADAASNAVQMVDPNEVNDLDREAGVESSWVNYLLWMLGAALAVAEGSSAEAPPWSPYGLLVFGFRGFLSELKFSIHKVPLETYMSKLWVYFLTTPSEGFLIQAATM